MESRTLKSLAAEVYGQESMPVLESLVDAFAKYDQETNPELLKALNSRIAGAHPIPGEQNEDGAVRHS